MIGPFWRTRTRWSSGSDSENSTSGDFWPVRRRVRGGKSPLVEFSDPGESTASPGPVLRTPGPGAAWSGGRL